MTKPYPLVLDLYSLILEAAGEPQINLHFPLSGHARTRRWDPRRGKRLVNGRWVNVGRDYGTRPTSLQEVKHEVSQLCPAAPRQRAAPTLPPSPQMVLFAEPEVQPCPMPMT